METADKLRRAISKDKSESRPRNGSGPLFVVPPGKLQDSPVTGSSFATLLDDFEKRIAVLARAKGLSVAHAADEICSLLRDSLRSLSGTLVLSDSISFLASEYWAEPAIVTLIEEIERDSLSALSAAASNSSRSEGFRSDRQLTFMRDFLEWLRRRQASLAFFHEREMAATAAVGIRSVLHDRVHLGARGFEVITSIRLDGFASQSLWLRLQLFADGEPVTVNSDWCFWQEDSELYIAPREDHVLSATKHFTTVAQILSNQQRLIVDRAILFVPYAALDVAPLKRSEFEIEVLVSNEAGETLCADAMVNYFALPVRAKSTRPIPSPLSLGFWAHNLGTGENVSQLSAARASSIVAHREVHSINIGADLELFNRGGERVVVEVRFLTREGHVIESELERYRSHDGTFLYSHALYPDKCYARFAPLQLSFPLTALEVDPGAIELFVELVVLDDNRQVICGELAAVELQIPELVSSSASLSMPEHTPDTTLAFKALLIDPSYSINGRDAIRIEILIADLAKQRELCQLRVAITATPRDKGMAQAAIVRGLIVERTSEIQEHSCVFVVDAEYFMPSNLDGPFPLSYQVLTEVVDQRGIVRLSAKRSFALAANFGSDCSTWIEPSYPDCGVEIVDAQTRVTPLRGGEVLVDMAINCNYAAACHKPYPIYFEPLIVGVHGRGKEGASLEGSVVEISLKERISADFMLPGERQQRYQIRLPHAFQSGHFGALKMTLFSPEGKPLQVLHVPVRRCTKGIPPVRQAILGNGPGNESTE